MKRPLIRENQFDSTIQENARASSLNPHLCLCGYYQFYCLTSICDETVHKHVFQCGNKRSHTGRVVFCYTPVQKITLPFRTFKTCKGCQVELQYITTPSPSPSPPFEYDAGYMYGSGNLRGTPATSSSRPAPTPPAGVHNSGRLNGQPPHGHTSKTAAHGSYRPDDPTVKTPSRDTTSTSTRGSVPTIRVDKQPAVPASTATSSGTTKKTHRPTNNGLVPKVTNSSGRRAVSDGGAALPGQLDQLSIGAAKRNRPK